MIICFNILD